MLIISGRSHRRRQDRPDFSPFVGLPACRVEGRGYSRADRQDACRTKDAQCVGPRDVVAHAPTGKMPVVQKTSHVSGRGTWLLTRRQARCLSYKRRPVCRVEGRGCSRADRQDACRTKGALCVGPRDVVAHAPTGKMPVVQKTPCVSGREQPANFRERPVFWNFRCRGSACAWQK